MFRHVFFIVCSMSLNSDLPHFVVAVVSELNMTHLILVAPTSQGKAQHTLEHDMMNT